MNSNARPSLKVDAAFWAIVTRTIVELGDKSLTARVTRTHAPTFASWTDNRNAVRELAKNDTTGTPSLKEPAMNTTTAVTIVVETEQCDRCPAAAKVRVATPAGDLVFCGHHGHEYGPRFLADGYEVVEVTR